MGVGLAFITFGAMLLIIRAFYSLKTRQGVVVPSKIVGYKQFPADKTIYSNDIKHGRNFAWLRVVRFIRPDTHVEIETFSNPAVAKPEPIGSSIDIKFTTANSEPAKNGVWVHDGMQSHKVVGGTAIACGISILLASLYSDDLVWIGTVVALIIIFATAFKVVWSGKNQ